MNAKIKKRLIFASVLILLTSSFAFVLVIFGVRPDFCGCSGKIPEIFVTQTAKLGLIPYKLDVGEYPSTQEGLNALMESPNGKEERWKGPYFKDVPLDPWGNEYIYIYPGIRNPEHYDLSSLGPDGVLSDDDIQN